MSQTEAYLFFDGTCAEAMRFYERVLGGTVRMVPASETPVEKPADQGDRIMHAHLQAGELTFMASDWMAPTPYPGMHGFSVCLTAPATDEAHKLFDALADGGQVTMPFQKTFYSDGFGMLTDRFGTPWMVMSATNTQS